MVAIFYNFSIILALIFLGLYLFALYMYNVYFLIFVIISFLLVLLFSKINKKPINMVDILYKMILIKLVFFMVFLYTNGIYCGSEVNKIMLQTATKVTVSAGMSPNQSQGFLGTIGGMTLFFGSTYMVHKLLLKLTKEPEVEVVQPTIVEEVIQPLPKKEPTTVQEQMEAHIKSKYDVIEFEKNYISGVEAKVEVYNLHEIQFNTVKNSSVVVSEVSKDGQVYIQPSNDVHVPDNIIQEEFVYIDQFGKAIERMDHIIELNKEMVKVEGVNLKSAYFDVTEVFNVAFMNLQKLHNIQNEEKKLLIKSLLQRKDSIIALLKNDPKRGEHQLTLFNDTITNLEYYSCLVDKNRFLSVSDMFQLKKLETFLHAIKIKSVTYTRIYSAVEAKDILILDHAWNTFLQNKTYYFGLYIAKLFYCAVYSDVVPERFDDSIRIIVNKIVKKDEVIEDLKIMK